MFTADHVIFFVRTAFRNNRHSPTNVVNFLDDLPAPIIHSLPDMIVEGIKGYESGASEKPYQP
jgi:hypothetical protein